MSWTVACFCGASYTAPPMECPRCSAALPDVGFPRARGGARTGGAGSLASIANTRTGLR